MSNMLVEFHNLYPLHSYQPSPVPSPTATSTPTPTPAPAPPPPPPYSAADHQLIPNTDQPSLPPPVTVQPSEIPISKMTDFQRYRQQVICSSCRQQVVTQTEYRISGGTWCMCCVVFFVGGFVCCFIPFLLKSCKDVVHRCPACGTVVGRKALI